MISSILNPQTLNLGIETGKLKWYTENVSYKTL